MMKTYTVVVLVVCVLVAAVTGYTCYDISGLWVNQHGSTMDLKVGRNGTLTGTYTTAVESDEGDAGDMNEPIVISGYRGPQYYTFGFSAMWVKGLSTTIWAGQCLKCDGKLTIVTSWLLWSKQTECGSRWKAVMIGQDFFTKKTATNQDQQKPRMLDIVTSDGFLEGLAYNKRHRREAMASAADTVTCVIPGKWYNAIGSMLDTQHLGNGILTGEYWTAKEMHYKSQKKNFHTGVHGQYNDEMHNTMAYFVSWNKGQSVTGWVGQCHVCQKANSTEMEAVLEMAWVYRVEVNSCYTNWRSTLYGQTTFRREVQRPVTYPGGHVVPEFVEVVTRCTESFSAAATFRPLSALTALALLYVLLA